MKIISFFNNKGGVGKTTLAFHTASALAESGKKVVIIDLDPQCNMSLMGYSSDELDKVWKEEESFIDDFKNAKKKYGLPKVASSVRSIHFHLKPTEDGVDDLKQQPIAKKLSKNLYLIPGRLSLHLYENKIASRWSEAYLGDPLALRTLSQIRNCAQKAGEAIGADYVIIDTSPSLGILNKVIISTSDGFVVPCNPDLFSLYGLRNIGRSLSIWHKEFHTLRMLLSKEKAKSLPSELVKFLGYTIYNAKKYGDNPDTFKMALADYNFAAQMPETIEKFIPSDTWSGENIREPIGGMSVMHSHNTLTKMSQKYKKAIWNIPSLSNLDVKDQRTITGNAVQYTKTKNAYVKFVKSLIERL